MDAVDREADLVSVFVQLADSLQTTREVVDTMDVLVQGSTSFTSAAEAGIMLVGADGKLHVIASTSERAVDVEEAQLGASEGPCLDAFQTGESVEVPDIAAERERWPRFTAVAGDRGFRAAHATPLRLRNHALGGINLFSLENGALSNRDTVLVQAMAEMATISIVNTQLAQRSASINDQLQRALDTRVIIEQAKGVLAERHNIGMDGSFALIRNHSRTTGTKLREIADQIVHRTLSI
jgi:GAF domain-containing protein